MGRPLRATTSPVSTFTLEPEQQKLLIEGRHCSLGFVAVEPAERSHTPGRDHGHRLRHGRRSGPGEDPGRGEQPGVRVPATIGMAIGTTPGGGSLGGTTPMQRARASRASRTVSSTRRAWLHAGGIRVGLGTATRRIRSRSPSSSVIVQTRMSIASAPCRTTRRTATVNAIADKRVPQPTSCPCTLLDDDLDCDGYEESSSTLEFNVTSSTRLQGSDDRFDTGLISYLGSEPATFRSAIVPILRSWTSSRKTG